MAINLVLSLTLNGKDLFWNSKNTGVKLDITHLQFGTRNRLTTGEESFLNQPKQYTQIQNGSKIGPDQVRIMATMPGIENYNVNEIGLWSGVPDQAGSILIAYKSVQTGFIAQMVSDIDLVFTYDMVISTADIDHVNIVKDNDQSSTFSLLAVHESDRNAHPYYLTTDTVQTISGAKTFTNKAIFSGGLAGELEGNASTATKLKKPRTVSFSGAATGSFGFDGSGDSSAILTLANSGVAANTYGGGLKVPVVTVNAKGLITSVSEQQIPIVDDLTTGGSAKLLSAEQGKLLQANKLDKTALNNTLTSTAITEALTAAQGKVLNDRFINDFLNLKSVNGYQKLPMGLIIQWGESQLIPDESSITGSFPIVFPSDCLSIQATINIDTLTNGTRSVYAKKISTAQFKLTNDSVNTLPAVTAFWLAIGY